MGNVPMPRDLSEEAVAGWLFDASQEAYPGETWDDIVKDDEGTRDIVLRVARAVLALVREKVRECIAVTESRCSMPRFAPKGKAYGSIHPGATDDEIVARVMGEEAPRG